MHLALTHMHPLNTNLRKLTTFPNLVLYQLTIETLV